MGNVFIIKMAKKQKTNTFKTSDGFLNLAARMGSRADNLFSRGTYIFDLLSRNRVKLEAMYRGSWLVGAAVDCIAEDMTRAGINIKGDPEPQQIQTLQRQLTSLGIWDALLNTIKWGRLYGGAIGFIVIDGQDPSTPLNIDTVGLKQFVGLRVYDRWQVQPDVQNVIQWGPEAGTPAYYRIVSNIMTGDVSDLNIHHSRIIRYVGIQLPAYQAVTEQYWGESVIERINDCIVAFDTATEGVANLVNKAHLRTVQIEGLRDILSAGGQMEENLLKMFKTMTHLQSNEGLTLLDKLDVFQTHTYNFSGLNDIVLQFAQQISGATGIPLVRLFGQSPAGLNSTGESDWRMYFDSIQAQQESRLRSGLMKIICILYKSLFGVSAPDNLDFDYVSLWQVKQKEKVDIAKVAFDTVAAAYEGGIIDRGVALEELKQSSEYTGIFTNISQEQIDEAKAEPPMPIVPNEQVPANEIFTSKENPEKNELLAEKSWLRA